ncbi:hypothetical protein QUC32_03600 [Novosphingobium resinovorum]|uniref:hypothetical protein n=1 Tax=Novosphingobium TaxID=165696 RepID=UPI001B3C7CE9|nr:MULTISPECIES: hypothetical protein [Novosphingobium]MBF7013902.1 hypothetical protein [Novosphingobium sp. HR1a]WJM26044.1 hypothetical protein QUC32_03600 [Novosphingobium resinovorum]
MAVPEEPNADREGCDHAPGLEGFPILADFLRIMGETAIEAAREICTMGISRLLI